MNSHIISIKSIILCLLIMIVACTFGLKKAEADDTPSYEPPVWKGNVTVGGNYQTGNTDRINFAVGADALRKSDMERYSLNFLFNYSEENSNKTGESYYGAGQYDYFFTKRIYGYMGIELLKDKFKDLSLRTVLGPGAGYQVWDEETRSLTVEGGISYFSENFIVAEDDDFITGRLAGNLMYKLMTSLTLTDQLIIYPSFENFGEFQLRNDAALSTPLASGWALKLINILEYDSDPPVDIENTDWNWILTMQYSF
jgi:putative salt-induced outer membrane protein YdiY